MIFKKIIRSFAIVFAKEIRFYKQHEAEIKFITGMVSGGAAIGSSAYSALKIKNIIDDKNAALNDIYYRQQIYPQNVYTPEQAQYEIVQAKKKATVDIVKTASIPILFTGSWAGFTIGGFLRQRAMWIEATTALSATTNFLLQYRGRVREAVGAEEEQRLYFGLKKGEQTIVEMKEDGTVEEYTIKTEEAPAGPIDGLSPYAFVFGPTFEDGTKNYNWDENFDYNVRQIRVVEEYFTNKLCNSDRVSIDPRTGERKVIPGSVLLNDVLQELGHPPTEVGCYVGWVHGNGDNRVDLGLHVNTLKERYWNGERCLFLDPNVDGVICDLIDKGRKDI